MLGEGVRLGGMFFVYDFGQIPARFRWEYDRFFYERWCREALAALLAHPERTDAPERADFFVIASTLRCVSFAAVDRSALQDHMASLPYVRSGKPHVVFDLTDSPQPIFREPHLIVCKSAFHERYYDPAMGMSIPQFPRYRFDRPIPPARGRRHLAGFKGNPRSQYGDLRQRLLALDDGDRLVIRGGEFMPADIHISEAGEVREVVRPGEWAYEDILFNSTFALLPRACGYALSYRMIESMNAGCVPVIISDGYVLPFREELNYGRFSVSVAESDVEHLREILEERLKDADDLQRSARQVYETHFASTERIIGQAMRLLGGRVAA